jgi:hypothetical protein
MEELLALLHVARSTMDLWRAEGKAPKISRLPNNELRSCELWVNQWMEKRALEAA